MEEYILRMLIKWGLLLNMVLVVPFILGLIPVKYMSKDKKTPACIYTCGWFLSFFVFEIASLPFILLKKSFTLLVCVYSAITIFLLIFAIISGKKCLREMFVNIKKSMENPWWVKALWLVVFLMIAFQMGYSVFYEYWDGDDAYYVATSVVTNTFDTMYLRDNYTGYIYDLDVRHAFSPTPIYQAWLSKISRIAPAIVAHSVLAPVWLMFMYCIYSMLAKRLLKENRNYCPVFMILINIWFVFGNISLNTAETFAMTRTWQGKGLMAGMVMPALLLCLLYLTEENVSKGEWILFVSVIVSAVFATSIAFMVIPTVVGVAGIIIGIKKRSFKIMLKMMLCLMPCLICAGLFLLL